jgi:hypothetical protein
MKVREFTLDFEKVDERRESFRGNTLALKFRKNAPAGFVDESALPSSFPVTDVSARRVTEQHDEHPKSAGLGRVHVTFLALKEFFMSLRTSDVSFLLLGVAPFEQRKVIL